MQFKFTEQYSHKHIWNAVPETTSASQDVALQTIVSRPHHLICPSQTV